MFAPCPPGSCPPYRRHSPPPRVAWVGTYEGTAELPSGLKRDVFFKKRCEPRFYWKQIKCHAHTSRRNTADVPLAMCDEGLI